jgi:hypothetical protein
MAEHSTLTGASLHENKHIDTAGTSDAGKVVTPSSTDAGEGELRYLTESEISGRTYALTAKITDIGGTNAAYVVAPFDGTITTVYSVIDQAIATADTVLTVSINGVSTTPSTLTIAYSGSAAGDVDSVTITNNNAVSAGDYVKIVSDGATSTAANAYCTLIFTKA